MSLTATYTYEEAPSDGAAVPSGSNGVIAIGGTVTYSAAAAFHGAYGIQLAPVIGSAIGYAATSTGQVSVYGACTTTGGSNTILIGLRNGGSNKGRVRLNSVNGCFEIADDSNSVLAVSTNTYVSNTFRVDYRYDNTSGTSLTITVRIFLNGNIEGTTPDETLGPVTYDPGLAITRAYLGSATTGWTVNADTFRQYDDATTWPAPFAPTISATVAWVRA